MIKTAILGQGYWGTKLSHTLQKIPNCNVTQSIDVKLGNDIDEIATDTEAVIIATPPQTHFELIQKALDKNLHIFVEKPICQNHAEVEQLQPLADKVLMTGHILLYNECTEHIKNTIDFTKVKRIITNTGNTIRYCDTLKAGAFLKNIIIDAALREGLYGFLTPCVTASIIKVSVLLQI